MLGIKIDTHSNNLVYRFKLIFIRKIKFNILVFSMFIIIILKDYLQNWLYVEKLYYSISICYLRISLFSSLNFPFPLFLLLVIHLLVEMEQCNFEEDTNVISIKTFRQKKNNISKQVVFTYLIWIIIFKIQVEQVTISFRIITQYFKISYKSINCFLFC